MCDEEFVEDTLFFVMSTTYIVGEQLEAHYGKWASGQDWASTSSGSVNRLTP